MITEIRHRKHRSQPIVPETITPSDKPRRLTFRNETPFMLTVLPQGDIIVEAKFGSVQPKLLSSDKTPQPIPLTTIWSDNDVQMCSWAFPPNTDVRIKQKGPTSLNQEYFTVRRKTPQKLTL